MEMEDILSFIQACNSLLEFYQEAAAEINKDEEPDKYSEIIAAYADIRNKKNDANRQLLRNEKYLNLYQSIDFSKRSDAKPDIEMYGGR